MGIASTFDPKATVEAFKTQVLKPNMERAAQYALSQLIQRIPVGKTGKLRAGARTRPTKDGFDIEVDEFYAFFVHEGHKKGKRGGTRKQRRLLRDLAKELRKVRKETGDESLKDQEAVYRKEAKRLKNEYDAALEAGGKTKANPFLVRMLNEERANLVAIIAGQ